MKPVYVARRSTVASRQLGGETIMMCPQNASMLALNPVGAAIWEAVDGHTPLETIVEERVCTRFEVDLPTALRDALRFVRALARQGALVTSERPFPGKIC